MTNCSGGRAKKRLVAVRAFFFVIIGVVVIGFANAASAQFLATGQIEYGNLYRIDQATGNAVFLMQLNQSAEAPGYTELESHAASRLVYMEGADGLVNLDTVDPCALEIVTSVDHNPGALNGLEYVGDTLYGTFITGPNGPSALVTVNPAAGTLTPVGATGQGPISGLAYDMGAGIMYGVTAGAAPANLVTINLTTGAATVVAPITDASGAPLDKIGSIEFGTDGNLYGGLTNAASIWPTHLIRINTTTGVATSIGATGVSITGLTADISCTLQRTEDVPTVNEWGVLIFSLLLAASAVWALKKRQAGRE